MEQYINFSYALPVKFYQATNTPGLNLDDDWAINQIKDFERRVCYKQKWQVADSTTLQVTSTIAPDNLLIYNTSQQVVGSLPWTLKTSGAGFGVYELTLNLDAAYNSGANPVLYLYQRAALLLTEFKAISEPIHVATTWPNTMVFNYGNSFNTYDLFFTTGSRYSFRCEAGIMDYDPQSENTNFIDEMHDVELLSATPFDAFKLYIGTAPGVAPYIIKILNYIVHTDNWKAQNLQYAKLPGSKWEVNRQKGYPLVGAELDITPAKNLSALQMNAISIDPGIVTGYILQTNFFGSSINEVQIEEINIID